MALRPDLPIVTLQGSKEAHIPLYNHITDSSTRLRDSAWTTGVTKVVDVIIIDRWLRQSTRLRTSRAFLLKRHFSTLSFSHKRFDGIIASVKLLVRYARFVLF